MESGISTISPPAPRRSVTFPIKASSTSPGPTAYEAKHDQEETIFSHPNVKTVQFNAPAGLPSNPSRKVQASRRTSSPDPGGKTPWKSRSEKTLAIGPIRLFRAKNFVTYLEYSGQPLSMLPNSQCWCVDGVSIFALNRGTVIYRFELPHETEEDKEKVNDFKDALRKVIWFEKTPCPFQRGFSDEISDEGESPMRRHLIGPKQDISRLELKNYWGKDTFGAVSSATPPSSRRSSAPVLNGHVNEEDSGTATSEHQLDSSPTSRRPSAIQKYREAGLFKASNGTRLASSPLSAFSESEEQQSEDSVNKAWENDTSTEMNRTENQESVVKTSGNTQEEEAQAQSGLQEQLSTAAPSISHSDGSPEPSLFENGIPEPEEYPTIKLVEPQTQPPDVQAALQSNFPPSLSTEPDIKDVAHTSSPPGEMHIAQQTQEHDTEDTHPTSPALSPETPRDTPSVQSSELITTQGTQPLTSPYPTTPASTTASTILPPSPPIAKSTISSSTTTATASNNNSTASELRQRTQPTPSTSTTSNEPYPITKPNSNQYSPHSSPQTQRNDEENDTNAHLATRLLNLLTSPTHETWHLLSDILLHLLKLFSNKIRRNPISEAPKGRLKLTGLPGGFEDPFESEDEGAPGGDGNADSNNEDEDMEDDYGVPLGVDTPARNKRAKLGMSDDASEK